MAEETSGKAVYFHTKLGLPHSQVRKKHEWDWLFSFLPERTFERTQWRLLHISRRMGFFVKPLFTEYVSTVFPFSFMKTKQQSSHSHLWKIRWRKRGVCSFWSIFLEAFACPQYIPLSFIKYADHKPNLTHRWHSQRTWPISSPLYYFECLEQGLAHNNLVCSQRRVNQFMH